MTDALVKICGLQDVEVLKSMVQLPVDYIGFVFAPSRRQVTAGQAAALTEVLGSWEGRTPGAVGVFVNPSIRELGETLAAVPLQVIQLHGDESPAYCQEVKEAFPGVKVWKAVSVSGGEAAEQGGLHERRSAASDAERYMRVVDALLLDTYDPVQSGGSGKTFAWSEIPAYRDAAATYGIPLFVAGGLHEGNVQELLREYAPGGIDVSSGVETGGVKDIAKITAFVERVKQS